MKPYRFSTPHQAWLVENEGFLPPGSTCADHVWSMSRVASTQLVGQFERFSV